MKSIYDRISEERAKAGEINCGPGDNARAAACYALGLEWEQHDQFWPFRPRDRATMDRRTELIRAAAHIIAELESMNVPQERNGTHD